MAEIKTKDPVVEELGKRALAGSKAVTSGDDEIQKSIQEAITGIGEAQVGEAERIESEFGREIEFQKEQFGQQRETLRERGRGFGTNQAALAQFDERVEKNLKDLAQRRDELIKLGNLAGAEKIAELEFNAVQFREQTLQQSFQNLVSASNVGIAARTEGRLERAQSVSELTAMADIAATFNVTPEAGDTIESVLARAKDAPQSEEDKLKIEKLRAEISKINAQRDKVRTELSNSNKVASPNELDFALDVFGIKFPPGITQGAIFNALESLRDEDFGDALERLNVTNDPQAILGFLEENRDDLIERMGQIRFNELLNQADDRIESLIGIGGSDFEKEIRGGTKIPGGRFNPFGLLDVGLQNISDILNPEQKLIRDINEAMERGDVQTAKRLEEQLRNLTSK